MNRKNNKLKVSIVINLLIFVLTVIASIIMFTGFKFMGDEVVLEQTKMGMLKFFTVDSNMFMGIMALIFAIKEIKILKGKNEEISKGLYILKLMATVGVALTFLTVIFYLGPISEGGIPSMLKNSNLFFHLIIPVVSIITFIVFERTDKLSFKHSFLGIVPMFIYSIFYLVNVLIHMENGKVSPIYDWYWFVQGGVWQIVFVMPLMIVGTYLISLALWRINRNKKSK
jgi:hypothetical protein